MPLYEVLGWGRESNRQRKRQYEATTEDEAIMRAGDDGTIVESVTLIGQPEIERAKKKNDSVRKRVLRDLKPFGAKTELFDTIARQLNERFGHEPNVADVAWGLYNTVLQTQTDYGSMAQIHLSMAEFLYHERRNSYPSQKKWAQMQLASWRESGVVKAIEVMSAPGCCENCRKQDGRRYKLEDALKTPPVPCMTCTEKRKESDKYSWCRCDMSPVMED